MVYLIFEYLHETKVRLWFLIEVEQPIFDPVDDVLFEDILLYNGQNEDHRSNYVVQPHYFLLEFHVSYKLIQFPYFSLNIYRKRRSMRL